MNKTSSNESITVVQMRLRRKRKNMMKLHKMNCALLGGI